MPIRNKALQFQKTLEDVTKNPDNYTPAELQALQNDVDDLLDFENANTSLQELKDMVAHLTQKVNMLEGMLGINDIHSFKEALRGMPGKNADENKVISSVLSRVRQPRDGKDADENRILSRVLSRLPKPKDESLLKAEIEQLKRDLIELENRVKNRLFAPGARQVKAGGGGGGSVVQYSDLSASCDGATRVFTITGAARILGVFSTQSPSGGWRPTTDWTFDASTTQLTLSSDIPFIQSSQTLWCLYVQV